MGNDKLSENRFQPFQNIPRAVIYGIFLGGVGGFVGDSALNYVSDVILHINKAGEVQPKYIAAVGALGLSSAFAREAAIRANPHEENNL